ncbi:MAG: sigma-E processing peptidase SpoIIGA [Eubacterium sp.]|nr:sigma-E processing peptidase SpoIIGA [Eubacterium sp.]MCM1215342.1 sigma-E processing peptidase SpoIIGA [Lachnospiraceae bacterium]MCM1240954.1 sigma-E processing peptidase SpoIIGA [Lachnospiraceae bacterium]MCM1343459.1 sigma-E processing peptidase SpoIIGA [Muribaculaceae bacterium]
MRYELYADSLLLLNFVMDLYLLILVDRSTFRTATGRRILSGAAFGAVCYFLPFVWNSPPILKLSVGFLMGTAGMLLLAFPVKGFRMFLKLLKYLALYSVGMGGGMILLLRALGRAGICADGLLALMGTGGILFLFLRHFALRRSRESDICRATLICGGNRLTVNALIDSGNSLIEPVSGKPVSVVDEKIFSGLWQEQPPGFRAIPYHSIGKEHGILQGYLLPGLRLEIDGVTREFHEIYVAVGGEQISDSAGTDSIKMIINPLLLEAKGKRRPKKRQNERKYDTEGGNIGKDAV